jgi:hypothetical protein
MFNLELDSVTLHSLLQLVSPPPPLARPSLLPADAFCAGVPGSINAARRVKTRAGFYSRRSPTPTASFYSCRDQVNRREICSF